MSKYDKKVEGIAKRTMILFFLVDQSASMTGTKIGAVNDAVKNVVPEIREIADESADAKIKIAVCAFSSGAQWMFAKAIDASDFTWKEIHPNGMTDMGQAFNLLNEKLSRSGGFMADPEGNYAPAIFLMSDGQPTDNYANGLEKLKANKWFEASIKAAIAIGDDADKTMLAEFTGNPEMVLTVRTPEALRKVIRFVSVTASKIGSKSSNAPTNGQVPSKQGDFNEQIQILTGDIVNDPNIDGGW
jgi:uncharacterized protein YegL